MQTKPCHQKPEVTSDPKPNSTSDLPLTSDTADLSLTSDPVTYDPDLPVTSDPDLPVISDPDNNLPFTSDPDLPDPHVPTHPLEAIKRSLCLPSQSWMIQKGNPDIKLQIYKVTSTPSTSKQPLVVTHCLTISDDLSWSLFVHNQELTSVKCPLLFGIPDRLTSESATSFLKVLDKLKVCAGQPDLKFVDFVQSKKGGVLTDNKGQTVSHVDDYASVTFNGVSYHRTIRSSKCEILVRDGKCNACKKY